MNITDPRFVYVPSKKTNVLERFKKMGFQPPSEKVNFNLSTEVKFLERKHEVKSK